MSGKVVGWAMEQRTGSPTSKLVLVKLADNANEEGLCWPSISLMVEHTELSPRAVRDHLFKLEESGLIQVERREAEGVHLPNRYHLLVPWRKKAPQAHPDKAKRGSAGGAIPPTVVQEGGASHAGGSAGDAGGVVQDVPPYIEEPSNKPSTEPSLNQQAPSAPEGEEDNALPAWVPKEAWAGYVEMRKKIRHPLTERAQRLELKKLEELRAAGENPEAVLDQSTVKSWRGLFPVRSDQGARNGGQSSLQSFGASLSRAFDERNSVSGRDGPFDRGRTGPRGAPDTSDQEGSLLAFDGVGRKTPDAP